MSPYSLQERLDIYKQALEDWCAPTQLSTEFGFCAYFVHYVPDFQSSDFHKLLPELFAQKPQTTVISNLGFEYWFDKKSEEGRKYRRICLIAAIEECEIKLKGHE